MSEARALVESLALRGDHELMDWLFAETFAAPGPLRERLYVETTPQMAGEALVHFARVRLESHRFDFDEDGRWALVLPIFESRMLVDFGAFDLECDEARR